MSRNISQTVTPRNFGNRAQKCRKNCQWKKKKPTELQGIIKFQFTLILLSLWSRWPHRACCSARPRAGSRNSCSPTRSRRRGPDLASSHRALEGSFERLYRSQLLQENTRLSACYLNMLSENHVIWTLEGSFSAVSKRNVATKYAFESAWRGGSTNSVFFSWP